MTSADNQQERLRLAGWVTGFVDGEGCFSIAIQRNSALTLGYQVQPQFVVVQSAPSIESLNTLQEFFGCGRINMNVRRDNHREPMYRFIVRKFDDLVKQVIPFFQANELRTIKRLDFNAFVEVVRLMERGRHLDPTGLEEIRQIVGTMNRGRTTQRQSRILRDYTPTTSTIEVKI